MILRHTLMNPWLSSENEGKNYLDKYCEYLKQVALDKVGCYLKETD